MLIGPALFASPIRSIHNEPSRCLVRSFCWRLARWRRIPSLIFVDEQVGSLLFVGLYGFDHLGELFLEFLYGIFADR